MAGRFLEPIPESLDKGTWTARLGHELKLLLMSLQESIGGLQETPDTPSRIEAGVAAAAGASQAPSPSDHQHDVSTAAPSVPVGLGGAALEGSGPALMRADAKLILSSGGATDGQILVYNAATSSWVAANIEDSDILSWIGL